jgi:hypothetical protein
MIRRGALAALTLGLGTSLWALDAEVDVQLIQSHVAANQELAVDRTLVQGTLSQSLTLAEGWTVDGTAWASLDTLPSQSPLVLPAEKLAFQAKVLEGWLGWSPLPGTLTVGAGKRVVHPSSGFSHTPLNFAPRGGATTGAQATSAWEEGWLGAQAAWFGDGSSAALFYAPPLSWGPETQPDGFAQGQLGLSLGTTDWRLVAFRGAGTPRLGLGVDAGFGDALTLRAEAAADTAAAPRLDTLVGATWTSTSQSTVMAEVSRDETAAVTRTYGFVRVAGSLENNVEANAWAKVNLVDGSGWLGGAVTYTADHWGLAGSWQGAWGSAATDAGSSALRWQTTVEVKGFL